MTPRARDRRGATIIELIVVLVILAATAGVTNMALARAGESRPPSLGDRVAEARSRAIASGRRVTVTVEATDQRAITAMPDGRVIAALADSVDTYSGRPAHVTR
jgi:prepilin-type N-terminal cleavage/methylation domain-containing protein